jgi:hypothetical protein
MNKISKMINPRWRPGQAALAGTLATAIYSIAMESDKYLIGNHFNDVRFIDGIIEGKRPSTMGMLLSWVIHLLNGIALAEVYGAVAKRWLPGPDWLKGSLFGELFVAGVWCLTPIADAYHPLIKDGEMPKLATWKSFGQNMLRHLAFGLVLGLSYKPSSEDNQY